MDIYFILKLYSEMLFKSLNIDSEVLLEMVQNDTYVTSSACALTVS